MKFSQGALIMYGSTGVCRVESIAPMPGSHGAEKERLYYKLSPLFGSGVIYVPVDTQIYMRPVISRQEALELIARLPELREDHSLDTADRHSLGAVYQARIQSHDCETLAQLIKSLYLKQQAETSAGKHPYKIDQDYLKKAAELLHSELACALEIDVADVPQFIQSQLQKA